MATTPRFALPYPPIGTAPNIPLDLQRLAEATEATISAGPVPVVARTNWFSEMTVETNGMWVLAAGRIVPTVAAGTVALAAVQVTVADIPAGFRPAIAQRVRVFQSGGQANFEAIVTVTGEIQFRTAGMAVSLTNTTIPPFVGVIWRKA